MLSTVFLKKLSFLLLFCILLSYCQDPIESVNSDPIDLEHNPDSPEIFGEGLISTDLYERDMAISKDGKEIIFTVGNYTQSSRALVRIRKHKEGWTSPEILSFSGKHQDIEPFFSPHDQTLFFASTRPIGSDTSRSDYNIWMVVKLDDTWGEPEPLPGVINTRADEYYPSVSQNGNLYFTAAYENALGLEDIYVSQFKDGRFTSPEPLDSNINSASYEFNAFVSPEEDLIIFTSYGRKDGLGGGDLYYSLKDQAGHWQKAVHVGGDVNSNVLDFCPFIDFSTGNFYFTSSRPVKQVKPLTSYADFVRNARKAENGLGNIYRIGLAEIIDLDRE
jgi:hypothetical protein